MNLWRDFHKNRFWRRENFHRIYRYLFSYYFHFWEKRTRNPIDTNLLQTTKYYMLHKDNVNFLKESEQIQMVVHRHWIVFVFKFIYLLLLIISSSLVLAISDRLIEIFWSGLFWGAMVLYWIYFTTYILISWINDELDLFIITNERIIGIEQLGPLSRKVSECNLDRVQEVNAEISGIMQTLFGYGHIHIHTASEHSDMMVYYAPHPIERGRRINSIISELRWFSHLQNSEKSNPTI